MMFGISKTIESLIGYIALHQHYRDEINKRLGKVGYKIVRVDDEI